MILTTGTVLNNRYRIVSLLGQGGMGAVYRAWDTSLGMAVALKENTAPTADQQRQFITEAQILAHLSHPNLPRVTDYFTAPGQGQYLVMDFIAGEDLQTMTDRLGVLSEAQVLPWAQQVCDALVYLHRQPSPVIHRDVKPANIKITPDGRAILVDFGIAKLYAAGSGTTTGAKAITPGFSPPEQYGIGTTDERSDIYALGATLYYLLTNQCPPESVLRASGAASLLAPRTINPAISPAIEWAVLRSLEIHAANRFQTARELQQALVGGGGMAGIPAGAAVIGTQVARTAMADPAYLSGYSNAGGQAASIASGVPASKPPPGADIYAPPPPMVTGKPSRKIWLWVGLALAGLVVLALVLYATGIIFPRPPEEKTAVVAKDTAVPRPSVTQPAPSKVPTQKPAVVFTSTPWIITATPLPATQVVVILPSQPPPPSPTLVPTEPPSPVFTAGENMYCREGPDTYYEAHYTVNQGQSLPALARWSNSWLLLGINEPAVTRTRCCWVGGDGSLNVPLDSLPLINYLPDRINCPLNP